jgi:hypothetical protein
MLKRRLFGYELDTSPAALDAQIASAVDMFMRAYGKDAAPAQTGDA